MTTNAATESKLGALHAKVAQVMVNALDVVEKAQEVYLELPADDENIGPAPEVSAPLLSAITKFLNDNKITCVAEDSEAMSELAEKLANKRKRRTVGNVVHLDNPDAVG